MTGTNLTKPATGDYSKVDMFFSLLRGLYGSAKYKQNWPTDMDEQLAKKLWAEKIEKHTEKELRLAIDHAQRMSIQGEDDWQWPNIGLILSGARLPTVNSGRPSWMVDKSEVLPREEQSRRAKELLKKLKGE